MESVFSPAAVETRLASFLSVATESSLPKDDFEACFSLIRKDLLKYLTPTYWLIKRFDIKKFMIFQTYSYSNTAQLCL